MREKNGPDNVVETVDAIEYFGKARDTATLQNELAKSKVECEFREPLFRLVYIYEAISTDELRLRLKQKISDLGPDLVQEEADRFLKEGHIGKTAHGIISRHTRLAKMQHN